jgi:broad specificity phosphatase PhoE
MTRPLILIKHSLPEIVENQLARDWKLSDEGCIRAGRLAERLIPFRPDVIVSSKEPKAKETAQIIADKVSLQLSLAEDLHEHDRSNTPYLSPANFQDSIREFFEKPTQLVFGCETAEQAYTRFCHATNSIMEKYVNKTIAVVSHGTVISLFVSRLTGIPSLGLWRELGLPSYVVLDMQGKKLIARRNTV